MNEWKTLKTMKEIKIMSNPIRIRILKNYHTFGQPATVKQMATFMGEVPANIHYHVRKLLAIGLLELHHTENIKGIIAKFYRPTAKYIKFDDGAEALSKGYINQKELFVANLFDENKSEFIKVMRSKGDGKNFGRLISSNVKLTKKEHQELLDYISNMLNTTRERSDEERRTYTLFAGVIENQ